MAPRLGLGLAARFQQVEIHFAAAQNDARHRGGFDVIDFIDDILKAAGRKVLRAATPTADDAANSSAS